MPIKINVFLETLMFFIISVWNHINTKIAMLKAFKAISMAIILSKTFFNSWFDNLLFTSKFKNSFAYYVSIKELKFTFSSPYIN